MNGGAAHGGAAHVAQATPQLPQPSAGGFVAVNSRPHESNTNGHGHAHGHGHGHGHSHGNGASSTTRHDLLAKFHTVNDRRSSSQTINGGADARRPSAGPHALSHPSTPVTNLSRSTPPKPTEAQAPPPPPPPPHHARPPQLNEAELQSMMNSPVPIPNTPSSLLPAASQRASQPAEKDDGGPYKVEMVHRMESLGKGERILPPCDRCRRLHMDCLKNLTACMGCTKKHAKCSWKEVREGELHGTFAHPTGTNSNMHTDTSDPESHDRASTASPPSMLSPHHGYSSSHVASSNGQSTPQPTATAHAAPPPPPPAPSASQPQQHQSHQQQHQMPHQHRPHPQQPPQYPQAHDSRDPPRRNSPPERDRERERHVEAQLQEAAKSGLAQHATVKPEPVTKGHEYQTAIAQQ